MVLSLPSEVLQCWPVKSKAFILIWALRGLWTRSVQSEDRGQVPVERNLCNHLIKTRPQFFLQFLQFFVKTKQAANLKKFMLHKDSKFKLFWANL
jgi:hypothetical protein